MITEGMARQLQLVTGIATTLIAFIAGLTLNIERLERRVAGAGLTTVITLAVAMSGLAVLAWLVWPWLPIAPDAAGAAKLAIIAMVVVIVVSFSPTMTAAVIAETGSRGKLSDFVLAMVVLADLIVLVLFSLAMQFARAAFGEGAPEDVNLLVRLAWEIGGAIAFGSLVGAIFALYLRYVGREVTLALLVVTLVLSQVGMSQRRRAAARSHGRGHRHRERGRRAGGDAESGDPIGRAAAARRVLRGGRARRCGSTRSPRRASRPSASPLARVGLIWASVRGWAARRECHRSRGRVRVDRVDLAGGHHAGSCGCRCHGISDVGRRKCRCCWSRSSPSTSSSDLRCSAPASCGREKSTRTRRARCSSSRTGSRISTTSTISGRVTCATATGGVAVALDALMRERGGTWIAHGAGDADRETVDDRRQDTRAARQPVVRPAAIVDSRRRVRRVLRRLCERGPVAAVSPRRRAAEVPDRGLGRVQEA